MSLRCPGKSQVLLTAGWHQGQVSTSYVVNFQCLSGSCAPTGWTFPACNGKMVVKESEALRHWVSTFIPSGGLRSSCLFLQGVFQPTLNYLKTIKFPFQQLGLMERFILFSFSCWKVIMKPSSEFSVKGKVYLGELKGLITFMPPGLLYGWETWVVLHGPQFGTSRAHFY